MAMSGPSGKVPLRMRAPREASPQPCGPLPLRGTGNVELLSHGIKLPPTGEGSAACQNHVPHPPGSGSKSQPDSGSTAEIVPCVQNHSTEEIASGILASFDLSIQDLEELSCYPDDQLTPENMPRILRDIQTRKLARQLPHLPSQSTGKVTAHSDDAMMAEHEGGDSEGPLEGRVQSSDVPTEESVGGLQAQQVASVTAAPSRAPSNPLNTAEEPKWQRGIQAKAKRKRKSQLIPSATNEDDCVPPKFPFTCSLCQTVCIDIKDWTQHLNTPAHTVSCLQLHQQSLEHPMTSRPKSQSPTQLCSPEPSERFVPLGSAISPDEWNKAQKTLIWVVGHDIPFWAHNYCHDRNLGLVPRAIICWACKTGMLWEELLPLLFGMAAVEPAPDVLAIHLGELDLDRTPEAELVSYVVRDLMEIRKVFPHTVLCWIEMLPCRKWPDVPGPSAVNEARERNNRRIGEVFRWQHGELLLQGGISAEQPELFLEDGMHLSSLGMELYLGNLKQGFLSLLSRGVGSKPDSGLLCRPHLWWG
ncbi:uncharacterized protein LOC128327260 [Hemicordylus capensis]|uniref:uncharacterized protein LOC128327260 n=1 Tax=Hemicordylus capensis TaxID=884348 RepID=UPI002303E615|nr:uncharacterized protein LOC128327260 [Hemicordylus capensis]